MADTLAVERLFGAVSASLADDYAGSVPNVFGWREPARHVSSGLNRIAWYPGDPSGNAGTMAPPRNPGRNPRPLGTLLELFTVVINGVDRAALDDEQAQYKATRLIYDAWFRAVYLAAHGTFTIVSERWLVDKLERRYGAALEIVCQIQAPVLDTVHDELVGATSAFAEIDTQLGTIFDDVIVDDDDLPGPTVPPSPIDTVDTDYVVQLRAGETMSALTVVRVTDDGSRIIIARPPEPQALAPLGILLQAVNAGAFVPVAIAGPVSDPHWHWIPGQPVLLGPDGTLAQEIAPGATHVVAIGQAIDPDTIVVRIGPPIRLA